jgi:HlyD family secretion protein
MTETGNRNASSTSTADVPADKLEPSRAGVAKAGKESATAPVEPEPPQGFAAIGSRIKTHQGLAALLLLAVLGAGVAGYTWWVRRAVGPQWPLVLQGNVEVRQVNLGYKVSGRIARLAVDEGDAVSEGQSLGTLEKVYFEDNLVQMRAQRDQQAANLAKLLAGNRPEDIAQAQLLVAERDATLINAKVILDRAEQLKKTGVGSVKTFDDAQAAYREANARLNSSKQAMRLLELGPRKEDIDAARAQLADKEAAIATSQRQLTDANLIAPSPGVVLSRVREKGAIVNAGETVFVLSLTSPVWVRTYISETELPRIRPGVDVDVKTDTPGLPAMKGRIGHISTTAEFTPKTVETRELRTALVYRLRVVVDDMAGVLRQGMPISVSIPKPTEGAAVGARLE